MKIENTRPTAAARPVTAVRPATAPGQAAPIAPVRSIEDEILVLGIPEAEQTPRVKAAISRLIGEVSELRRELEGTKRRLDELEVLADEDPLVALLNRRAFVRELTRTKSGMERYGTKASLVYLDLNNFKTINDRFGHAAGDEALKHVADILRKNVRSSDILARLGGDEFGVILVRATRDQAQMRAEMLVKQIEGKPLVFNKQTIPISVAFGVYEITPGGDIEQTLAGADQAMYAHKQSKDQK